MRTPKKWRCRVPVYPTDESGTRVPDRCIGYPVPFCRFYYPNRKWYSNKRDKQDKQEDLPLETAKHFVRYALPIQPLQRSRSALKSSSTLSGLATVVLIFLFSGTRIPDRYGNRVPGSKNIRKRTGLVLTLCHRVIRLFILNCPTISNPRSAILIISTLIWEVANDQCSTIFKITITILASCCVNRVRAQIRISWTSAHSPIAMAWILDA